MISILKRLKPYAPGTIISMLLVFVTVLCDLNLPSLMSRIVNEGIAAGDTAFILATGLIMVVIALVGVVASIISGYLSARIGMGFGKDLRNAVYTKAMGFTVEDHGRFGTASLITRTTNDVNQLQMMVTMGMRMFIMAPLNFVGGIVMAVTLDSSLSVSLLVLIPLIALLITFVFRRVAPLFDSMQKRVDDVNLVLRENLTGVRVVRAFNRTDHEIERFDKANKNLVGVMLKANRIMAGMFPLIMALMNLAIVGLCWFGAFRVDEGGMEVGTLMAFGQYIMQILFSIVMSSMMFIMIPRAAVSASRINEVLGSKGETDYKGAKNMTAGSGRVSFEDVTFRFPGAESPALKNISFETGAGEITAIIGSTGSGKTSILNLILRFYEIESGTIKIDGTDIRNMTLESLRKRIGYVPQRALLFSGSVTENIAFGGGASEEEVGEAARVAQADFVREMEEGFDSFIAQGGTNLSGGQRQRLSIARAIARKPEIYLFDDSFSALDFKTDAALRAELAGVTQNASVIIVAQRVSTIMNADRILVLEEGGLAGMGTHRELMDNCEVYREIVRSQMSEEESA